MWFARSKAWTRALAAMGLSLTLLAAPLADATNRPPPPPPAHRLIRIGPQALVKVDARGHVTMADEPAPTTLGRDRSLQGLFSILSAGFLLFLENQGAAVFDRRAPIDIARP